MLKVVYQSKDGISRFFNFKDVVNHKLSSHLVYRFPCCRCNGTYYDQIQRCFYDRACENCEYFFETFQKCYFIETLWVAASSISKSAWEI